MWTHAWIYDRLIDMDRDFNMIPGLAKTWKLSDGGRVHTLQLYDNVWWHDGVKFTSADVKWHFDTLLKGTIEGEIPSGMPAQYMIDNLISVDTPDDYTAVFRYQNPTQIWYYNVLLAETNIMAKHIYEGTDFKDNPAGKKPVGTGPFKFVEWASGSHAIFERHDKYHHGKPYLDKVIIRFIPDSKAALLALEADEINAISPSLGVPLEETPRLKGLPGIELANAVSTNPWRIIISHKDEVVAEHPWIKDVRVRKALCHAIDRKAISDKIFKGFADVTWGPVSSAVKWAVPADIEQHVPQYDPKEAERLLDEAGYTKGADGIRFRATGKAGAWDVTSNLVEVIRDYWKQVGVLVEWEVIMDRAAFSAASSKELAYTTIL
jgi:peptide/nickel transport system substrate-binding protein